MFGLGMSEMVLIGIVALIVIGPKDLPGMFRAIGQFTGKARGMAREFSRAMEAAADESGIREVQNTLRAAADPKKFGSDKIREATGLAPGAAPPAAKSAAPVAKTGVPGPATPQTPAAPAADPAKPEDQA